MQPTEKPLEELTQNLWQLAKGNVAQTTINIQMMELIRMYAENLPDRNYETYKTMAYNQLSLVFLRDYEGI